MYAPKTFSVSQYMHTFTALIINDRGMLHSSCKFQNRGKNIDRYSGKDFYCIDQHDLVLVESIAITVNYKYCYRSYPYRVTG